MRFLRKYIFANAALKILSLGISFLLWATYTAEPFAEVGFQVPLEFTSMPAQLEISGDVPNTVRVRVRGRSALLRRVVLSAAAAPAVQRARALGLDFRECPLAAADAEAMDGASVALRLPELIGFLGSAGGRS